ncbi:MAG TPA: hypothetical protein VGN16_22275 [Acidobacteriaceae bacterium]|jgi:hypothetical protein
MGARLYTYAVACALLAAPAHPAAGAPPAPPAIAQAGHADVRVRLALPNKAKDHPVPAVIWLESADGSAPPPFAPHPRYTLLQKNRMFMPHLLVVPVGATVSFPNADPFFHNVFSLFDGKRFDLGLYEAGSSKDVRFTREGVSYIFCNIHPEMSAVVVSLSTPLYSVNDGDSFDVHDVPPGDYTLHLWVEGVPGRALEPLGHPVHVATGTVDLGELRVPVIPERSMSHTNKFGMPYDPTAKPTY